MNQKYTIVTGSTKGIGKAIAEVLLQEGYHVIFNYASDSQRAKEVAEELKGKGFSSFTMIQKDLSNQENVLSFVEECLKVSDSFSSLVLNAGITDKTNFQDVSYESFMKVMETNLTLPFLLVQKLSKHIEKEGNILFIGSSLGTYPHASSLSYGVSKGGLVSLAQNLVKEFAEDKIRVNIIAPGFVDTEWQKTKPAEIRQRIEGKIALGRFCPPEEIAEVCLSVMKSTYINGALIPVDGGYSYK